MFQGISHVTSSSPTANWKDAPFLFPYDESRGPAINISIFEMGTTDAVKRIDIFVPRNVRSFIVEYGIVRVCTKGDMERLEIDSKLH